MRNEETSGFGEQEYDFGSGAKPFRSKLAPPLAAPDTSDPTFEIRRKQANLCEAVMLRVIELETAGKAMLESAKKLRAAVLANT